MNLFNVTSRKKPKRVVVGALKAYILITHRTKVSEITYTRIGTVKSRQAKRHKTSPTFAERRRLPALAVLLQIRRAKYPLILIFEHAV